MSSDDIANLYRQFGGMADGYQELGRDNVVRQSRERWPLLDQVRQQDAARGQVRSVSAGSEPAGPLPGTPLATVFDEAAAAAEAQAARDRPPAARPRPAVAAPVQATAPVTTQPMEPTLTAEPLPPARQPAVAAPALPPFARPRPAAAAFVPPPAPAPATARAEPAGTELQGLFARLARAPEPPPAAPADRETSLLRRLLRS